MTRQEILDERDAQKRDEQRQSLFGPKSDLPPPKPDLKPPPVVAAVVEKTKEEQQADLHAAYMNASANAADPVTQELFREQYLAFYERYLVPPQPKGAKQ